MNTTKPLSNIQYELLKLYSSGIPDESLYELKTLMANYFLMKARNEADNIWLEKQYTVEKIEELVYGT